jgi:hypothetical protein
MTIYKYVSVGASLSREVGKVSYFHEECAVHINCTLGPNAIPTTEVPPEDAKCPWCGKGFEEERWVAIR